MVNLGWRAIRQLLYFFEVTEPGEWNFIRCYSSSVYRYWQCHHFSFGQNIVHLCRVSYIVIVFDSVCVMHV